MSYRIEFSDWIAIPVPRVFEFFADPENLPRMMPPATQTRIEAFHLVTPPPPPSRDLNPITVHRVAGKGSIINTSFRPLSWISLRQKWTAAITEFEWNHHFADVQQKGPFKRWHHRHEFLADHRNGCSGTLVNDVVEYEVGFGPLGSLANALFIERGLRETFAYRQKQLPNLLF